MYVAFVDYSVSDPVRQTQLCEKGLRCRHAMLSRCRHDRLVRKRTTRVYTNVSLSFGDNTRLLRKLLIDRHINGLNFIFTYKHIWIQPFDFADHPKETHGPLIRKHWFTRCLLTVRAWRTVRPPLGFPHRWRAIRVRSDYKPERMSLKGRSISKNYR